jgi:8-oxo-dGTP pyrophosphatase MutT (NUDIX family)/phosphohistidine phosphatase SixA
VTPLVRAAGGAVLRRHDGHLQILLVHRPRYDDWSLPKGKAAGEEGDVETARREVEEETGLRCAVGPELPSTGYVDSSGRNKVVRYWLMLPIADAPFEGNQEIDAIRWVEIAEGEQMLSYPHDRPVVAAARDLTEPLYLLRHGKAGSRTHWRGDDRARPLSSKGQRQAEGLVGAMEERSIARVLSSGYERCVRSVTPLAEARGLVVERASWLEEGTRPSEALDGLLGFPGPAVLCSHGDVIVSVVEALAAQGVRIDGPKAWKKGSTWVVEREIGVPSLLRYEPPPRDRAPRA